MRPTTLLPPIILCALALAAPPLHAAGAGRGRHDLVSYVPPAGWQKDAGNGWVRFTRRDGGSWAQLVVYASTPSAGGIAADFDGEWSALVAGPFGLRSPVDRTGVTSAGAWQATSGSGVWQHDGANVATLLTTWSGHGVRVSILCNATAQPYLQECSRFLGNATLDPPSAPASVATTAPTRPGATPGDPATIARLGASTWTSYQNRRHASGMGDNAGRSTNRYRFSRDGSYRFGNETFQYHVPKYFLVDEEGRWSIDGDVLTLTPTRSRWSRHAQAKTDPAVDSGATGYPAVRYRIGWTTIHDRQRLLLWPLDRRTNPRDGSFNYYDGGEQDAYLHDAE